MKKHKEIFIKPKRTKIIPRKEIIEPEIKYTLKRFTYDVENERVSVFLKADTDGNDNDLLIEERLRLDIKEIKYLIMNKFNLIIQPKDKNKKVII